MSKLHFSGDGLLPTHLLVGHAVKIFKSSRNTLRLACLTGRVHYVDLGFGMMPNLLSLWYCGYKLRDEYALLGGQIMHRESWIYKATVGDASVAGFSSPGHHDDAYGDDLDDFGQAGEFNPKATYQLGSYLIARNDLEVHGEE